MPDVIERLAGFDPFAQLRAEPSPAPTERYMVVDVFTDTPLEGNQLGVFTDARALSPARMQQLARELNFSETVFCCLQSKAATPACASSRPRTSFPSPVTRCSGRQS